MSEIKPKTTCAANFKKRQWIAEAAYYKALARGFTPNLDQQDWLEAQKDYAALQLTQGKNGLVSLRRD